MKKNEAFYDAIINEETQIAYLLDLGIHCPFCGTDETEYLGHVEQEGASMYQHVRCCKCRKLWTEQYKLIGFWTEDAPALHIMPLDTVANIEYTANAHKYKEEDMANYGGKRRGELAVKVVEEIMEKEGLGWFELAARAGLEASFIGRVRDGQRTLGDYSIRKVAEAFPDYRPALDKLLCSTDEEIEHISV